MKHKVRIIKNPSYAKGGVIEGNIYPGVKDNLEIEWDGRIPLYPHINSIPVTSNGEDTKTETVKNVLSKVEQSIPPTDKPSFKKENGIERHTFLPNKKVHSFNREGWVFGSSANSLDGSKLSLGRKFNDTPNFRNDEMREISQKEWDENSKPLNRLLANPEFQAWSKNVGLPSLKGSAAITGAGKLLNFLLNFPLSTRYEQIIPNRLRLPNTKLGLPSGEYPTGWSTESGLRSSEYPMKKYGGQTNYGLDLRHNYSLGHSPNEDESVNNSIKPVDRKDATIEAEKGETILIPFGKGGEYTHFTIPGKKHTKGGTPLDVPEGSFVFSDTKKMKIGGEVLSFFNKSDKKPLTPADIAKQYKLNKYNELLKKESSDRFDKDTAELMVNNNTKKLGVLASLQESKKGYPNGIPEVSKTGEMKYGGLLPKAQGGINYINPYAFNWQDSNPLEDKSQYYSKDSNIINNTDAVDLHSTDELYKQTTSKTSDQKSIPNIKSAWSSSDKLSLINSLVNQSSIKKQQPWEPVVNLQTPNTTFYSPDRALSANSAEASSTQRNNSMLAGPQARYMNTFVQGKAAENAANLIGQYGEKNVSLQNSSNDKSAQITNQQLAMNAERAKRLYDAGVIGEQQYQNAAREARAATLKSIISGNENASNMYNMNMTESPYYIINPYTHKIQFNSGKSYNDFLANKSGHNLSPDIQARIDWIEEKYGKDSPESKEAILRLLSGNKTKETTR